MSSLLSFYVILDVILTLSVKECLREKSHRNVLAIVCTSPSLLVAAAVIIDIVMVRTQLVNR